MRNLRRDVKQPVRHPRNPLIVQDQPWERRMLGYASVLHDEQARRFRCWYLGHESWTARPKYYVCYAESEDGIRWHKPMVGSGPFGPYERHNIVISGGHGACVMETPWDPDGSRRFKAAGGDLVGWSTDGIHWTLRNCRDAVGKNDTCPSFAYWRGAYLYYVRNQEPETGTTVLDAATGRRWSGVMRGVGLCTSDDFETWTAKRSIIRSDARDGYPWGQPHALGVTAYGDVLIGLLPMMRIIPEEGNNIMGPVDVQLAVSRDGRHWDRVADRAAFMPQARSEPAKRRDWDARFHPASTMFLKDDVVYCYYPGADVLWGEGAWRMGRLRFGGVGGPPGTADAPDTAYGRHGIGLATLPADRFVSLRPVNWAAEGIVTTTPFTRAGDDLLVNADVDAADLQVAVLDDRDRPLAGFGSADCRLERRDPLRFHTTWAHADGRRSLAGLGRNRAIALQFTLRDGDLYAFQIV